MVNTISNITTAFNEHDKFDSEFTNLEYVSDNDLDHMSIQSNTDSEMDIILWFSHRRHKWQKIIQHCDSH